MVKHLSAEIFRCSSGLNFGTIVIFDIYKWFIEWPILQSEILCWWCISFFKKHDIATTANEPNNYLKKISDWVVQWKMSFHPGLTKKTQKVIFSRKLKNVWHLPLLSFSNANVLSWKSKKDPGFLSDSKLNLKIWRRLPSNTK